MILLRKKITRTQHNFSVFYNFIVVILITTLCYVNKMIDNWN